MNRPERFSHLPQYAFARLRGLLDHLPHPCEVMNMSIGEPKHPPPALLSKVLHENIAGFSRYPANDGTSDLRHAIRDWINRRYNVGLDADENVMALNGTREGLFSGVLASVPDAKNGAVPKILIPNPFYQVYAAGALAAKAMPVYVPAKFENGFLPDFQNLDPKILDETAVLFLCSPSNPQGAIASREYLHALCVLAERHDFLIFSDECYSEIYREAAPTGLLEVAAKIDPDLKRVLVFHSLSKRSNMPGLRSGFVAGGKHLIDQMKQLRAYAGAPLPDPLQAVSAALWRDEAHVTENRALYHKKYEMTDAYLGHLKGYQRPEGGFFVWFETDDGERLTKTLWERAALRVLPGAYLSREVDGYDPGQRYIRIAMVAPPDQYEEGIQKISEILSEETQ